MLINSVLADNIKKHRKAKKLTQTELADKIHVSCQAVSKWERGAAVPELDKLCLLCDVLKVSSDTLIGNIRHYKKSMIGVDGGGSKTEFILFNEDGCVLKRLSLSSCNPNAVGIEASFSVISEGIDTLMKYASGLYGVYIGSSGFATGGNGDKVKAKLEKKYQNLKIGCNTDIMNVVSSANIKEDCLAAICGTGNVVYSVKDGEYTSFSGWGYLLDMQGAGYQIGRDGIVASLEMAEGLGRDTKIGSYIERKLGLSVKKGIRNFYEGGQSYIASFATCVFEAYRDGDEVASEIVYANAKRICDVIRRAYKENPGAKSLLFREASSQKKSVFLKW